MACERYRRQEVVGASRDLAREHPVKEDMIREPVELIDEDLDVVAGGVLIVRDVNIADIDQSIRQTAIGALNTQVAVNVAEAVQVNV